MEAPVVKRALISVSDKEGIVPFARQLVQRNIELISTGGTYAALSKAGITVTDVAQHTGHPEIMGGRVKTLHPTIHGGILARRDADAQAMDEHGILPIDMVVVNLYPFSQATAERNSDFDTGIENIDIGGVALVRAAAKNHREVLIVIDSTDYPRVIEALDTDPSCPGLRQELALKAYTHTAEYDRAIAHWFSKQGDNQHASHAPFPRQLSLNFQRLQILRYGENPHQQAALYKAAGPATATASEQTAGVSATAQQLRGEPLSFNNVADADIAWQCVSAFENPACVIVKHANPCGVALAADSLSAYDAAYQTDPVSAFGGIIAFNRTVGRKVMEQVLERQFVELIVAPGYDEDALKALDSKPKVRVLATGGKPPAGDRELEVRQIMGGILVQEADTHRLARQSTKVVSKKKPSEAQYRDLLFAWQVAHFVKSNAIVYAHRERTLGIGAGQMSRVLSVRIAGLKADESKLALKGASMASDAFFPFRDGVDLAATHGIGAVIQPGGSMRDQESIDAADEHGMVMVFTGVRHFKH